LKIFRIELEPNGSPGNRPQIQQLPSRFAGPMHSRWNSRVLTVQQIAECAANRGQHRGTVHSEHREFTDNSADLSPEVYFANGSRLAL
jgi:hypothetical protein